MLGILLIYWIGRTYYELAVNHEKNKWLFAFLGVVSYYAGSLLGGVLLVLAAELAELDWESYHTSLLDLCAMPFGALACWQLYRFLERRWSNTAAAFDDSDILDRDV